MDEQCINTFVSHAMILEISPFIIKYDWLIKHKPK